MLARWNCSNATAGRSAATARHYYDLFQLAAQPEVAGHAAVG